MEEKTVVVTQKPELAYPVATCQGLFNHFHYFFRCLFRRFRVSFP